MATNWSAIWKQAAKAHRRAAASLNELREDVAVETIAQRRRDDGRRVTVEAMYSGTGLTEPEQFTAKELTNFRRLAWALDVLVAETSPLLED